MLVVRIVWYHLNGSSAVTTRQWYGERQAAAVKIELQDNLASASANALAVAGHTSVQASVTSPLAAARMPTAQRTPEPPACALAQAFLQPPQPKVARRSAKVVISEARGLKANGRSLGDRDGFGIRHASKRRKRPWGPFLLANGALGPFAGARRWLAQNGQKEKRLRVTGHLAARSTARTGK